MEINEPILAIKVTQPGRDAGITSRLSRGMHAFTIKVDVASDMSGFLRPSHRVDVYWTGFAGNGNRQSFTQLIKSGVEIIAIDQTADGDRSGVSVARTVTVQVSPQDVGILAQAQSSGALTLSLVGDDDDSLSENVLVDQRALLGLAEDPVIAQVEVAPVDRVCTIKTRRGADVLQIPVPCSD
jgi:pilus assembly protein CpaB